MGDISNQLKKLRSLWKKKGEARQTASNGEGRKRRKQRSEWEREKKEISYNICK